mgnify:CR=1 FL=1
MLNQRNVGLAPLQNNSFFMKIGLALVIIFSIISCNSIKGYERRVAKYKDLFNQASDSVELDYFNELFPFTQKNDKHVRFEGASFYDINDSITGVNFIVLLKSGGELRGNIVDGRRDGDWVLIRKNGKKRLEIFYINGKIFRIYDFDRKGNKNITPRAISGPF